MKFFSLALVCLMIMTASADAQLFGRFRGGGGCADGSCAIQRSVQTTRTSTASTVSFVAPVSAPVPTTVYLPSPVMTSRLYLPAIPETTTAQVVIIRSAPVMKAVSAQGALRFHAGHNCPSCGAYRNIITGQGPGGTHTHTCPSCRVSWYH